MSYNAGAQRVPAWKRLGLKLKGPAAGEDPVSTPSSGNAAGHPTQASQQRNGQNSLNASPASALKRKQQAPVQTPSKKIRLDQQTPASVPSTVKRQKSVTFAEGTKETVKPEKEKKAKQPKKKKEPKKKSEAPKNDFSLEPALSYLRQWHTARQSWKFNKNHQTLLIKYLFDAEKIPSADIPIFYQYIRDLKGFVRTRLRETAQEIKKQDMEQGVEGFPSSTKDKETKQKEYEAVISDFLKAQQELQYQRQQNGGASSTNANGKRSFDEVEFVIRVAHPEVKQRLFKRIRAEMVLDELSDSESTISTDTTMTTTSTTSSTADKEVAAGGEAAPKRSAPTKSGDGPAQPAKRRRLRKVRTDIGDDESSSDSSSDDDSDSSDSSDDDDDDDKSDDEDDSSSSSSSDSDSDEEMDSTPDEVEGDDDSSSSSSSSSESESESEASDDAKGAEDSSSSESSDSDDD